MIAATISSSLLSILKEIMGKCFKAFKGTLYKKFILKDKEPNWDGGEYTKQKDFW